MNRSKLIWGIICLAIAGALVVANLRLPPGRVEFKLGERDVPWLPPAVLAVIGVALIVGSTQPKEAGRAGEAPAEGVEDPEKAAMNKRLESVAWGLFLVFLGCMAFVPETQVKEGWWSIGVGFILLGLNAARYFTGLRMSGFTILLGVIALATGIGELFWVDLPGFAILLILLGANLLLKPWFEKKRLFGKAEES